MHVEGKMEERIKKLARWAEAKSRKAFNGLWEAIGDKQNAEIAAMRSARYCTMLDVCGKLRELFSAEELSGK